MRSNDTNHRFGRRGRTYRQRRKTPAPVLLALFAVGAGFALWADGWVFTNVVRFWAVMVPSAVALGVTFNILAPVPGPHGRLRVTVYDHGPVVVKPATGPESVVPVKLTAGWGKTVHRGAIDLALEWPTHGKVVHVELDSFGSSRSLRKALADREFVPYPLWHALGFGAATAAALAALIAWAFTLAPFPLPDDREDLGRFCGDPSMTFAKSPEYEGEGPHPVQLWSASGYDYEVSAALVERGWSEHPEETVLIACGEEGTAERAFDCPYIGGVDVPVNVMEYRFEVFEALTHRRVGGVTVEFEWPEDWSCPEWISEDTTRIDVRPPAEAGGDALAPLVEQPADS